MSILVERESASPELGQAQRAMRRRLQAVRRRLRWHLLVEGLFWIATALLLTAAGSLVIDRWLRLNPPTRWGLLFLAVAAIAALAWRKLVRPISLPLDDLDLAELLDRRSPGVGQKISNVLQLPTLLEHDEYASPSMVRSAVAHCAAELEATDLESTLNLARRRWLAATVGLWLVLAIGFSAAFPTTAGLWARRWFTGSTVRWPQHNYLNVTGLNDDRTVLVPRGEMSLVQFDVRPGFEGTPGHWRLNGRGETLVVESESEPQPEAPEQVAVAYLHSDGTKRRGNAAQFDERTFRYELPPLAEVVELDVVAGDDWFGPITIEPVDRPTIRSLTITSRRPGASQDETSEVGETGGQLLFLPDTQLTLRLVASQPLSSAVALDKGALLAGWERVDDHTYMLTWSMRDSLAIEFRLIGQRGALTSKPYFLAIALLKDREPRVTIRSSGVGRRVTPVARIPLAVRANDDFGVVSLALDLERTTVQDDKPRVETNREELDKPAEGEAPLPPRGEVNFDYELALRERGMAPGNLLKLRGVATDACAAGAQAGSSRWLSFQIVAPDELFYEILMRQREQRAKFTTALDSAKAQVKSLAELATPEDALGIARAQQVIGRQVFQVANQLDLSLQEMTLNELGNAQARENLQSAIIAPLRSLHGDLLTRLRGTIDTLARQGAIVEERRGEVSELAEEAVTTMQAILAQMSLWESFIDVVNQLKQVIDRQGQVLKSTEEVEKQRTDDLFDK